MAELSPFPPDASGSPRKPVIWIAVGVGVVLAIAVVLAYLALDNGRDDETVAFERPRPTTTLGSSRVGSGQVQPEEPLEESQVVYTGCAPITQTFPLPDRSCVIGVPPDVGLDEKLPAVVLLHGFNTSSADVTRNGGWDQQVVDRRLVLVRPEGMFSSWNAGGCCGFAMSSGTDDVGYLDAVMDQVVAHPNVDPSRVYMVGESNGGMMAYFYACRAGDRLAGIASVGGSRVVSCETHEPIDTLHAHGTADETVPYNGGQSLVSWVLGVTFPGLQRSMELWAAGMECEPEITEVDSQGAESQVWEECPAGVEVRLDTIQNGPHAWFRGRYDATDHVLDFFGLA